MSFLDFVAADYSATEHYDWRYSSSSTVTERSIFEQVTRLIRGEYVLGTACSILLTAGLSKGMSVLFAAAGSLFAPDLFIGATIIGELAGQIICDLGNQNHSGMLESFLARHAVQFAVAIPTTLFTYTTLALATTGPLALGGVILASFASFLAYRIMVVVSVAVFSTIVVTVLANGS